MSYPWYTSATHLEVKTVLQKLMVEIYTRLAHRYIKNDLLHPLGWFLKILIDTTIVFSDGTCAIN